MTEYAVELADYNPRTGRVVNYGQVHVSGCKDLIDGEDVGTDALNAHVELWPENEPFTEAEFLSSKYKVAAPCAKAAYRADKKAALA